MKGTKHIKRSRSPNKRQLLIEKMTLDMPIEYSFYGRFRKRKIDG